MKRILSIFSALLLLSSCTEWLSISPRGEVEEGTMFDHEEGFLNTLTGSYIELCSQSTYARSLTVGFVEEIMQNWFNETNFKAFNYTDTESESALSATWAQMYKAIANTNLLLDHLKEKKESDLKYYKLIKGEALGLRAFLHLDLLRLFGPVLQNGLEQTSIPYHQTFSNQIVPLMPAREVLTLIRRDLEEAYGLLKDDPIKIYGASTKEQEATAVKDLAFDNRAYRMNYYAVAATLARYHILMGEMTEAYNYATEVIDSELFPLVTTQQAVTNRDYIFQSELVWAINDELIQKNLCDAFGSASAGYASAYKADADYTRWVYFGNGLSSGSSEDRRYSLYWKTSPQYYFGRYDRTYNSTGTDQTPFGKVIPVIRITEMYYIAAEALIGKDNKKALEFLNTVRRSRNVHDLDDSYANSDNAVLDQVVYEWQKDSWGEGKMFYLYKRLYRDIVTRTETFPASTAIYELPIPMDEIEYGAN